MRFQTLAALCFTMLVASKGYAMPPFALHTTPYPQKRSHRYTTSQGLPAAAVTRLAVQGNNVFAETSAGLAVFEGASWRKVEANQKNPFPALPVDSAKLPAGAKILSAAQTPDKRLWIVTDKGAFRSEGNAPYRPLTKPTSYLTQQPFVNVDALFSCVATDAEGHVWLGTNFGVYATDGKNFWNPVDRRAGLPYENVTSLAFAKDGAMWVGTTEGVCRYTSQGEWQYYWGPRWLPHNQVNALAVAEDNSIWVATQGGVAHIYAETMTLEKKAAHYETITARHNRRGFVTGSALRKPGDPSGGVIYEASDNDGLWTALYVGAEAYRYSVTKSPQARELAKKSMGALLDLLKYTGIPGFPARAIFQKNEEIQGYDPNETVRVRGETEKIWFTSPVDPNIICKGDTSSDELDGHYYAWYLYHKLVADEGEKREIAKAVRAVTDNILSHDLTLVGHTGRKTLWGVWHPKYINDDPTWWEERGLNSLEILAFLKVAEHICGDKKYGDAYRDLIEKHHYLLNTVNQKVAEPWYSVNHSDDEMAFMIYYILMDLEREPSRRRILNQSLERSWKIERPEASPFFNFVYGAMTDAPCDVEASVMTLQDWPWELVDWEMRGTHRMDVSVLRSGSTTRSLAQTTRALPPSERRLMRWNGNPYESDGGDPQGRSEEDAVVWLLPYWMGRYHGFIKE